MQPSVLPKPAAVTPARPSWGLTIYRRIIGRSNKPTTVPRDSIREGLETIVFVVVLVFLLKQFVVEAFVIPTGSMAETLFGDHKIVRCVECDYEFQLNSHSEIEATDGGQLRAVGGYCCPNCRTRHLFTGAAKVPTNWSGDRVLVLKPIYHRERPQIGDVVVFKFPEKPQKDYGAQNYIKRLWATGGQTLAIWRGDLYVCDSLTYPESEGDDDAAFPRPKDPNDLWRLRYAYTGALNARRKFEESKEAGFPDNGDGFKLIRKSDRLIEEMKRIVYDNEHQAAVLAKKGVPPRWKPETPDWTADAANKTFTHSGSGMGWLRYKNLVIDDWRGLAVGGKPLVPPQLIDNFLGYNGEITFDRFSNEPRLVLDHSGDSKYWVGDLIVECQANVTEANAEIVLELSKGPNRFQAIFKDGSVTIRRTGPEGKDLATAKTPIVGPGEYKLRFANVDCRLNVWVNGHAIPFDQPVNYSPRAPEHFDPADVKKEGWVRANDIEQPVSIGAAGGVSVGKLKIWRDTFFVHLNESYNNTRNACDALSHFYVQPGHYLCLGDNSAQSLDSRAWGTVPERLMLGKAVTIFWPYWRVGLIK